jgi:RNA polymerase sigma-70 factor, ECF subfamily
MVQDTTDNLELRALLERAQRGDAAAFSDLYGRYAGHVLRFLVARLRDHELAQDLTQEVFIRILKAIGSFKYQGERSFLSWMYAIASNVMISYIRRAKATHLSLEDELELADPQGQEAVSGIFNRVSLQQAMSKLTGDQQQVLLLRFYGDLSNAEIARQLNKTEGAVKALQHRALQTLQHIIGRENDADGDDRQVTKQHGEVAVLEQRQRSSSSDDVEAASVRLGYWQ